jgi:hypothetical protein
MDPVEVRPIRLIRVLYECPAALHGEHLAVHRDLRGEGFTLTHLPTGRSILQGISTYKGACKIAERLGALDWSFTSERMPQEIREAVEREKRTP